MGANRVGGLSRSSLWPGGFASLGSMAALSRLYTAASELLFMWPAASRRWAVWRLSADYTRRRLEPTVHCGPAASRRWAVWRHSSADIIQHGGLSRLCSCGPAASRRWAVRRRLSADYTRRLPSCCSCGPAASRRWAVWRLSADYTTRRCEPTVCS